MGDPIACDDLSGRQRAVQVGGCEPDIASQYVKNMTRPADTENACAAVNRKAATPTISVTGFPHRPSSVAALGR